MSHLPLETDRVRPDVVPGKPDRRMLDGLLLRNNLERSQVAMVGDRLYTDMAMARSAGVVGILVLTGEATASQVAACDEPPDLVVEDLGMLERMLRQCQKLDNMKDRLEI